MIDHVNDPIWLAAQVLVNPWSFLVVTAVLVFLVLRVVVDTAKKRIASGGLDKFLRTVTLAAELLALLGVTGVAGYVGKTVLQSYSARAQIQKDSSPERIQSLSTELFKAGSCWYRKPGDDATLHMGLTEVCAIAKAGWNSFESDFDSNFWKKRIDSEMTRRSATKVVTILGELKVALGAWENARSRTYWLDYEQKIKAATPDFFYLLIALIGAIGSVALKIGKAWAERIYKN
jgi:hypothetical protein